MNLREYDDSKRGLDERLARAMLGPLHPFVSAPFSAAQVALNPVQLTLILSRLVLDYQWRAAELARSFYDAERERVTGRTDRHDVYLSTSTPDYLTSAMRLAVAEFEKNIELAHSPDDVPNRPEPETEINKLTAHSVTLASHGDRATMRDAARSDPACLGWARVDPNPPACGFCTMLISRGPVYTSSEAAGDERNIFHPNDTCRVVPVFDDDDWAGKAAYEAANEAYISANKEASETGESVTAILDRRRRNAND
ncbi:MAG: hypothetical protein EKK42_24500 [Pseudonocardiaceae bacterium]|nr:MAG: hypothetical protein EKK42_24500 [Pseudonocardiaceae bacterium]